MSKSSLKLEDKIRKQLCLSFSLDETDILNDTNLFKSKIDSIDYLKFAKLIASIAKSEENLEIDLVDFLNEGALSINDICTYIDKLKH